MSDSKKIDKKILELMANQNLQNIWIDIVNVAIREDGVCILRFFSNLPEGAFEQSRVVTNIKTLKSLADVLCSNLNYYPSKKSSVVKDTKKQ